MKLEKKKALAARALGVGIGRIVFNRERISDIKEAITKQDMIELLKDRAISIRQVNGRKTVVSRKIRRRGGSIKKKVLNNKREYVTAVRGLRAYLKQLKRQETVNNEQFISLRKEIRARKIGTRAQLRERLAQEAKK